LVQHIMTVIADRFRDRDGGYTRVIRTGRNRLGDGTDIVVLQLVGEEEGPNIGGGTSSRRRKADRRTAFAASLRKAGSDDAVATQEPDQAAEDVVEVVDAPIENTAEASTETAPESTDEPKADEG
jgi:large subunit ribosomal protein L17